jgi:hypothetical protein
MRPPQSIIQSAFLRTVQLLTIGMALALLGMVPLSAGAATPQLVCTPASLRFGAVVVGQTETLLVAVTNSGATSVTVSGISASSPEFTTSNLGLPLVLPAGQSIDLSVTFTPTTAVWTGDTIDLSSDASNPTLQLGVRGIGVTREPVTASPPSVPFGPVAMGASSTVPVVLTNNYSWNVTLLGLSTTGSGFSLSGPTFPLTLSPGQSVAVKVTFTPQLGGTAGGSLFVSGPVLGIPLTGTGTAATQYSVNLLWNSSSNVVGYNIYRSSSANGTYSKINSSLDPNTSYTDSSVASGQTYYYAATSVNSSGLESARSTPAVQAAVP